MQVIAVSGTSGKTSTTWLAAAALAEAGLRVGVLSDLGCLGLDDAFPVIADYAHPATLRRWLDRLAAGGCSHAVVEVPVGMPAGPPSADVHCDTLVVTNRARPRLDPAAAGQSRRRAAEPGRLPLRAGGCLVSGVAGSRLAGLLAGLPGGIDLVTAGLAAGCDLHATPVEAGLFGRTVLARAGGQIVPLSLVPPVVSYVRDALLAAAVAVRHGVPLEIAVRGIEAVGCVPGRMERLDRGQDAAVFIDMPSTGHALSATLASLRRLTAGRLCVIADESLVATLGGDEFGPLVARHCDHCLLASPAILDPAAQEADLATYARIDRLLDGLGRDDCLLVLGDSRRGPESPDGRLPLATIVDGWLRIASEGVVTAPRRAA